MQTGQTELLEIIAALCSPPRFSSGVHCRQQQADQEANNGNDYQEFNQRKRATVHGSSLVLKDAQDRLFTRSSPVRRPGIPAHFTTSPPDSIADCTALHKTADYFATVD